MDKEEILKLANLVRLEITDEEAAGYKKDFDGILDYIDSIKDVEVPMEDSYETNLTKNYMRNDDVVYSAGEFTDDLLNEAPDVEKGYFKVKKVL